MLSSAGWQLHEEVSIAALSCGRTAIAETLIAALDKKFPGSKRVLCLRGMAFEAVGNFDGAEKLYDTALESKATFAEAIKRKVRCYQDSLYTLYPVRPASPCMGISMRALATSRWCICDAPWVTLYVSAIRDDLYGSL